MYEHEAHEVTERLQRRLGQTVTFGKFCFILKTGGTGISDWKDHPEQYQGPAILGTITKIWYDYECGIRMKVKPQVGQPVILEYLERHAYRGNYDMDMNMVPGEDFSLAVQECDCLENFF